eukprot:5153872-Pleurochrysis_carterae.AAC.2
MNWEPTTICCRQITAGWMIRLLHIVCLALCLPTSSGGLIGWPLTFANEESGIFAEPYGTQRVDTFEDSLALTGNNRLYLVRRWAHAYTVPLADKPKELISNIRDFPLHRLTSTHRSPKCVIVRPSPPVSSRLRPCRWAGVRDWTGVEYRSLQLLGSQLKFTVDLSGGVDCNCNAAVYLVAMRGPTEPSNGDDSGYCDIQSKTNACTEIDLFEGNRKAAQSTLHTREGHGADGTCNQDGCFANIGPLHDKTADGRQTADIYGPGAKLIDTNSPFDVLSTFSEDGTFGGLRLGIGSARGDACTRVKRALLTVSASSLFKVSNGRSLARSVHSELASPCVKTALFYRRWPHTDG